MSNLAGEGEPAEEAVGSGGVPADFVMATSPAIERGIWNAEEFLRF